MSEINYLCSPGYVPWNFKLFSERQIKRATRQARHLIVDTAKKIVLGFNQPNVLLKPGKAYFQCAL
jgi:hypothetical protein